MTAARTSEPETAGNAEWLARRNAAVARGIGHSTGVFTAHASNAEIWDVEGKRYVDFAGGIAVLNTGHRHPKVMAAVREQMERFTHTCFQVTLYDSYVQLAERLNALAPISGLTKTALFTTGAEATENAIKIARAATGRSGVIAFTGGFHGRTIVAMNMTGKVFPYKKGLGPAQPEIYHVPFPAPQFGVTAEELAQAPQLPFQGRHRSLAGRRDHRRAGARGGRLPYGPAGADGGTAPRL